MCGTLCTQCVEQYVPNVWLCDIECVMYAGTADLTGPDSVAVRLHTKCVEPYVPNV